MKVPLTLVTLLVELFAAVANAPNQDAAARRAIAAARHRGVIEVAKAARPRK